MSFLAFLRENARWVGGGFLLTFFSFIGQTFFISLSAGDIRAEYGLSLGQFGTLYMIATLGSALTLPKLGQIVDQYKARTVVLIIVPALALAAALMAFANHIVLLLLAIYLLRLLGQGMMSQIAFTTMGRWFSAQRGRAVSIMAIGVNFAEASIPFLFVVVAGAIGWRNAWLIAAALCLLVALPAISALFAVERTPRASDPAVAISRVRDWTRGEVARDPLFYMLLLCTMASPFIGTTIFFHQVYLVELRGWSLELFASSFTLMATMTVVFSLISGQLVDRFTGVRLLPFFLFPLGIACFALGLVDAELAPFAFMALMGVTYGFASTLFGSLWPEIYGTAHLGSIRAMTVAIMVFATAAGPGLTGFLIDAGVSFSGQIVAMGVYCLVVAALMFGVSAKLQARRLPAEQASITSAA